MAQFLAFQEGVEVNGAAVLAVVEGMGRFKSLAHEILALHGIKAPSASNWYPQQAWLDTFKDIGDRLGPASLLQIGKQIPQLAPWPQGLRDIHEALASIDQAYHLNHRGGDIGHYRYEKLGSREGRMVCRNPYPCDFDRGIILGIARRFGPLDSALLEIPHRPKDPCRKHTDEECVYQLEW